jgi:reactive intermediate/imine deaminase
MKQSEPKVTYFPNAAGYPFSDAVRVGCTVYLAGQIGIDASGKIVPGGITAETKQAMENIKAVLKKCGSTLDQVVNVTVTLADMNEWAQMNAVYQTYFPNHFPARSATGANGLAMGARVEITCTAVAS